MRDNDKAHFNLENESFPCNIDIRFPGYRMNMQLLVGERLDELGLNSIAS